MIPTLEWLQRRKNAIELEVFVAVGGGFGVRPSMPSEDWLKIQAGIAEMFTGRFSTEEVSEIRDALAEADAEFARGEALNGAEIRRPLGLA